MALNFRNAEATRLAAEVADLANHLDQNAFHCAARPVRDQRSADEICGYDTLGLPS